MRLTLLDYGLKFDSTPIYCDNTSAINLTKNPILHSRTKHIDLRHHFLRDHVAKNDISIHFVPTDKQIADIFTKPLCDDKFCSFRLNLGVCSCPTFD